MQSANRWNPIFNPCFLEFPVIVLVSMLPVNIIHLCADSTNLCSRDSTNLNVLSVTSLLQWFHFIPANLSYWAQSWLFYLSPNAFTLLHLLLYKTHPLPPEIECCSHKWVGVLSTSHPRCDQIRYTAIRLIDDPSSTSNLRILVCYQATALLSSFHRNYYGTLIRNLLYRSLYPWPSFAYPVFGFLYILTFSLLFLFSHYYQVVEHISFSQSLTIFLPISTNWFLRKISPQSFLQYITWLWGLSPTLQSSFLWHEWSKGVVERPSSQSLRITIEGKGKPVTMTLKIGVV